MAENLTPSESAQPNKPWQLKVPEKYTHPNIRPEEISEDMIQQFAETPLSPQEITQLFESVLMQTWSDLAVIEEGGPGYEYQAVVLEDLPAEGRRVCDALKEAGKSVSPWDFVREATKKSIGDLNEALAEEPPIERELAQHSVVYELLDSIVILMHDMEMRNRYDRPGY